MDLRDTIDAHGDDWSAQAIAYDHLVASHIEPYFEDQAAIDAGRLAMLRHTIFGAPRPNAPPAPADRVTFGELRLAALFDPTAFRAFWNVYGMIRRPNAIYTDPEVVACTRRVLREHGAGPPMPEPTREQLLGVLKPFVA